MRCTALVMATLVFAAACGSASAAASPKLCQEYTVKTGDTLWGVATALKIDGTELQTALEQCIGYTANSFLQVGQDICLPPYYPSCKFTINSRGGCKLYVVQQGDTVASIATSFGTNAADLLKINKGVVDASAVLHAGDHVRLAPWNATRCSDPAAVANSPTCRVFAVREGDTLSAISSMFKVSVDALVAANPGVTPEAPLTLAQPIKIPPFPTTCGAGTPTTAPSDGLEVCRKYAVQLGDSISSIALAFGLAAQDIVTLNSELADSSMLTPGGTVKIPPWVDSCSPEGVLVNPPSANPTPGTTAPSTPTPTPVRVPTAPSVPGPPSPAPKQVIVALPTPSPAPVAVPVVQQPVVTPSGVTVTVPAPAAPVVAPQPVAPQPIVPATYVAPVGAVPLAAYLVLRGASATEFAAVEPAVIAAVAKAAGVPATAVTLAAVSAAPPGSRRLLAPSDVMNARYAIVGVPTTVQAYLQAALADGSLAAQLQAQGLKLEDFILAGPDGQALDLAAPAAPVPAGGGSSLPLPLGAIIGIAVGGVALLAAVAVGAVLLARSRRRNKELRREEEIVAARAKALRKAGVNAYVTTLSRPGSKESFYPEKA